MRSTFKLLYFVKRNAVKKNGNAPIIARITIDQVVAQFNTKLEINPAHWSVELGKASGRTAEAVHINSMLESIRSTVHQHYHALMAQDGYVTAELVKNAFLGFRALWPTSLLVYQNSGTPSTGISAVTTSHVMRTLLSMS